MAVDQTKIGLTFAHPRMSRALQEARLREAGFAWIVGVGVDVPTWRDPVWQLMPGDVMGICAAAMVASPKLRQARAAQLAAFVGEVHGRGAHVVEVMTGRASNIRRQLADMTDEAVSQMRGGGMRLPARGRTGRLPRAWPDAATRAAAFKMWRSRNLPSDRAAIREIMSSHDGVSERMIRALGPSGRKR